MKVIDSTKPLVFLISSFLLLLLLEYTQDYHSESVRTMPPETLDTPNTGSSVNIHLEDDEVIINKSPGADVELDLTDLYISGVDDGMIIGRSCTLAAISLYYANKTDSSVESTSASIDQCIDIAKQALMNSNKEAR